MDFYDCKLRLHGLVTNEVLKHNMPAPEILLLRKIHGEDAVVDLKYSETKEISDSDERERLARIYDSGLKKIEEPTSVSKMFGESFMPLLATLPEFRKEKEKAAAKEAPEKKKAGVI